MNILRKTYILFSLSMVAIASLLYAGNVIKLDWNSAHRSYSMSLPPINWLRYHLLLGWGYAKRSLLPDHRPGLPQVHLYIPQRSLASLMQDVPFSAKQWQKGYLAASDGSGTLQKIRIRTRGDNPFNWMYQKKSWRVKTRKSELVDLIRIREYLAPQGNDLISQFAPSWIAGRLGILTMNEHPVELFINGESNGISMERTRLDESFIRAAGLMPVNIYKGEQYNLEAHERVDRDLFNNPGLWQKVAYFNHLPKDDKSGLERFLSLVRSGETNAKDMSLLLELAPRESWAKYAAYQVLVQSLHNDMGHNMRLVGDPWSGTIVPLAYDVGGMDYNQPIFVDAASHSAFRLFHLHSGFLAAKYKYLFDFLTKDKTLSAAAAYVESLGPAFDISVNRDIHLVQNQIHVASDISFHDVAYQRALREQAILDWVQFETSMTNRFSALPQAGWEGSKDTLDFFMDGEIPASALRISLQDGSPKPSFLTLDSNGDGKAGQDELRIPVTIKNNIMEVSATWLANRVWDNFPYSTLYYVEATRATIQSTRFSLIGDTNFQAAEVSVANFLTGERVILERHGSEGVLPTRFNMPVLHEIAQPHVWSGDIHIKKDQVFRTPIQIAPGTTITLSAGVSVIFRRTVSINGSEQNPVIIKAATPDKPWGTFALQGQLTNGSGFSHLQMTGGSGDVVDGIHYTAMLSIHDTADIELDNIRLSDNHDVDDMLHIVYSENVTMTRSVLDHALSDAIDVDLCENVRFLDVTVLNAGNDAIDLMGTDILIERSVLEGAGDKGVSVGEGSNALIVNSIISDNVVGVQAKDGSVAQLLNVDLVNNDTQLGAYNKNWRYGSGGTIDVRRSMIHGDGRESSFDIVEGSQLSLTDSDIVPLPISAPNITLSNSVTGNGSRVIGKDSASSGLLPLYAAVSDGPWRDLRGSTIQ